MQTPNDLRDARILIVDDEVGMSCLVSGFLDRLGYRHVRRVNKAPQVFLELEAFQPDLMLLDLMMPGLNGFQVLDKLRRGKEWERVLPVLVLTGETAAEHKRRALSCGATDLLGKPFDPSEFAMRVRNLLEAHFTRRALAVHNQKLEERVAERTRQLEQAVEDLRAAQQRMIGQQRLHAFGEMAGGVVHDFGNTLMSIVGYSELLVRDPSLLEQKEVALDYLRTINTAGRDAGEIVARLRDFYRPREAHEVFDPVDLNRIVEETIALTQPKWSTQAMAAGKSLAVQAELGKIPRISGVAAELREALTNLIFNAVDATASGSITLRTRREDAHVVLEVCDTGAGMSPEVRERCLEPFFSTKGEHGTGLGLSMVFGVVKRHDGTVEVESTPGCGTTFFLRFPSLVPRLPAALTPNPTPSGGRPLQALVVDDQEVTRNVLERYLQSDGHRVATASNGHEALRCCELQAFDLILTDLNMPGMNGAQLGALAKRKRPEQKVILLTGNRDLAGGPANQTLPPEGVDLVLHKPVSQTDLHRGIASLMLV